MLRQYWIEITEWIIMIILLIKFIPKDKIREAQLVFLFKQSITWPIGLAVAELRLIEYPIRFFPYSTKNYFTFEYFIYPSLCALFNTRYPEKKSAFSQFMYYFYYCTSMTIIEVILERYTNVIKYIHWHWYVTWITLFITFYLSRLYYVWFFRLNKKSSNI